MNFNEYQELSKATAQFPRDKAIEYVALGIADEAGEVAGKIKKYLRGDYALTPEKKGEIGKEIGDVLWYLSQLCTELGLEFEDVAAANLAKLTSRMERGVIKGNGDNR